ncbi:ADR252Wp [Eremothecium gossypii ATCC 10895]|uniref:Malate dehydrogenase n=1 Tax=Eremothecium gossypii (strain ATCC 10895 / CBS 109.51 / FGSC 9923 / NRRL Y-1056) TaxID=284811 RepID=Q759M4_EREGS|nr:ADR252Wp [Eremothecium gossypii ATCC 10895]AAS52172.2 ADR252Wp [Eremothecium gossypii ATCC 10895]AEY96471.1 FADR252Wp [Eremothecium gossypii FDAG1]
MARVTVLGAAGGIGQPLSLLLKTCSLVSELNLYDLRNAPGVAADVSHVNTDCRVAGFEGPAELGRALRGADLVVIPAGVPRKPGMTRDDLFGINAGIVQSLVTAVAEHCPAARLLIISNPVNSTVPIAVETLKRLGKLNAARVFGVTTLDLVRAQSFLADALGRDAHRVADLASHVTVVGGHAGRTIVPLLADAQLRELQRRGLYDSYVHRVQFGGDEVVKAKAGAGSATLSMALAGFHFAELLLRSLAGEAVAPEPAFVYLPGLPGGADLARALAATEPVDYFAAPVRLAAGDAAAVDTAFVADLAPEQRALVDAALPELAASIRKGVDFVHAPKARL